ncbi:thioredoxin reductase [Legionella quinlivanii]|uniref:Thioredoxin reductase n=1 Tax=Legionella quinlivanii TaxID=45073 RepID=A0A0W0XKP6_9GAMM|nr:NAD(P)/FAD-dependent oxidoreductase [Legionella quinlivanii]KTD45213.1 thioredoxin reductase [Legionella quinlivanii]SEG04968.1 thioredoxin reductase (NADPH) [Legionella quinlivanii DSM 21216]STY11487.1 thioredoxin reductase [Legionella quinlivanii]
MKNDILDCIIIGGGPAGLTAGLYLSRFRRNILIYDGGISRAEKIPLSHNYPGFPQGISGQELLTRLRQQLSHYEATIIHEFVESIKVLGDYHFQVKTGSGFQYAKNIILATGVKDIEPRLGNINDGIQKGLIRHCPVCDAFEVINKKVAVIGYNKSGLGEALFLREYTPKLTLLTLGETEAWSKADFRKIKKADITLVNEQLLEIELTSDSAKMTFNNKKILKFDCLYSALGSVYNNQLANELGVKLKEGAVMVNKHQQSSIKGFYAAGDVVHGLNQICVATSQAAIAATDIHNRCRDLT